MILKDPLDQLRGASTRAVFILGLSALRVAAVATDFSEVERVAAAELKEKSIPGCAIAIVSGDQIVFAKGFGVASVETGEPVRSEMLFRLGSTTKMFTATAVAMLAQEGKLRLDAPVGDYVPGLNAQVARVTAAQLLSHTAGLRDGAPMDGLHDETALGDGVRQWKEDMFFTEAGRVFSYANTGFWLAGHLAAKVDGRNYADVLDARIFKPLGMVRTTLRPTLAMTYPLALGHEPGGRSGPRVSRPLADNAATWPAGQIFSSVHDLSRWCAALMNEGKLDGKQILAPWLIRELTTPRADMLASGAQYGLGLVLGTWHGARVWQHSGNRAGYGSLICMAPDHKFAVVLLMNLTGGTMPKTADKAMELAAAVNPPSPPPASEKIAKPAAAPSKISTAQYAGRYQNGAFVEELVLRNGKLLHRRGAIEQEVTPLAQISRATISGRETTLIALGRNGKTEFFLVLDAKGAPEFLVRGEQALARLAD